LSPPEFPAVPGPVTIPLSPEMRKAYEELYEAIEATIENTRDASILLALNARQADVDNVLTKDDMYRLHANTELFEALKEQIDETNEGLEVLKHQISSIASGFSEAGQVLSAINKVLSLVPGI
jgi:archaellum component FlaC